MRTTRRVRGTTMTLTSDDIARVTATPERTVRYRLAKWRAEGGPVTKVARPCGGLAWAAPLDAYCARVGLDAATVRAALAELAEAA